MADSDELAKIAAEYRQFAENARLTHYDRSDLNALLHRLVGGGAVIAAAIVSTSVLTNLNKDHPSFWLELAAGILAIVAGILSGLQTFYKFGEIGERHRLAGAHFGELRRELELFDHCKDGPDPCTQLRHVLDRLGKLEEAGPGYPAKVYEQVAARRRRWRHWLRLASGS
jgi:hypothetical protein